MVCRPPGGDFFQTGWPHHCRMKSEIRRRSLPLSQRAQALHPALLQISQGELYCELLLLKAQAAFVPGSYSGTLQQKREREERVSSFLLLYILVGLLVCLY